MKAERKAVKEWLKAVDREELDAMLQAAIFTPDDGIEEGATNVTDYVKSVTELNGKVTVTKGSGKALHLTWDFLL